MAIACGVHRRAAGAGAFRKGGVDLVLTDLTMPGLDGSKLIEEIKKISPQTPAILVSGKVKMYDRDTKADVFLPKGMYAPVELLERYPHTAGPEARSEAHAAAGGAGLLAHDRCLI